MAAKSSPIGVRFNLDMLEVLKEDEGCETPQQALNFLSKFWHDNNPKNINFAEKFKDLVFEKRKTPTVTEVKNHAPDKKFDSKKRKKNMIVEIKDHYTGVVTADAKIKSNQVKTEPPAKREVSSKTLTETLIKKKQEELSNLGTGSLANRLRKKLEKDISDLKKQL
jgi:hypothetical protein